MPRESAQAKGRRYLVEGRLTLQLVDVHRIAALCRGDGRVYALGWNPADGWWCSCPAVSRKCAHLNALRTVCLIETGEPTLIGAEA